jgi:hypothetical protein
MLTIHLTANIDELLADIDSRLMLSIPLTVNADRFTRDDADRLTR